MADVVQHVHIYMELIGLWEPGCWKHVGYYLFQLPPAAARVRIQVQRSVVHGHSVFPGVDIHEQNRGGGKGANQVSTSGRYVRDRSPNDKATRSQAMLEDALGIECVGPF